MISVFHDCARNCDHLILIPKTNEIVFGPNANSVEVKPGVPIARSETVKVTANQGGKCVSFINECLCIAQD